MSTTKTESKTRRVFRDIHAGHLETEASLRRFRNLITTDYLRLDSDFFRTRTCADLGAGSAAHGTVNLLNLGARLVHALDLDEDFKASAEAVLGGFPEFADRWRVDVGSLSGLPYADGAFDFVLCQGVLHHVEDDLAALREIHRVLGDGGKAYVAVAGAGGIMTRIFFGTLRDEYGTNRDFARLVDTASADWVRDQLAFLAAKLEDDGTEQHRQARMLLDALAGLIDRDFLLTVRDRLQAPIYRTYAERDFADMLRRVGFREWYRVSRRPHYRNLRRVVSYLYGDPGHPLARLLYGDGALNVVATK